MSLWRRDKSPPPEEVENAKAAVQRANHLLASSAREIEEARTLAAAFLKMRQENHLADRLGAAFRGA